MPPRKKPAAVAKTPRVKKEKPPPLKTPTKIKVKIQRKQAANKCPVLNGTTPLNIDAETEIKTSPLKRKLEILDRANEVADAQLNKTTVVLKFEETPPKKRGRRKKSEHIQSGGPAIEDFKEPKAPLKLNITRTIINNRAIEKEEPKGTVKTLAKTNVGRPKKTKFPDKIETTQRKTSERNPRNKGKVVEVSATSKNKETRDLTCRETTAKKVPTVPVITRRLSSRKNNKGKDNEITGTSKNVEAVIRSPSISVTSNKSYLNWTKDISSSASSLSNVVACNGKIPVLRIENISLSTKTIDNLKPKPENNLSDSDTSDSDTENSDDSSNTSSVCKKQVNLSSTSLSSSTISSIPPQDGDNKSKIAQALQTLSNKLKNFDLEFANWFSCTSEEPDQSNKRKRVVESLKQENEVVKYCQEIKRILSDDYNCNDDLKENDKDLVNVDAGEQMTKVVNSYPNPHTPEHELETDTSNQRFDRLQPTRDNNDDDDAISLYADSLIGLESVKQSSVPNNSNVDKSDTEEYTPKPITKSDIKFNYEPTKILDRTPNESASTVTKTVEKQSADSTSIHKEVDRDEDFICRSQKPQLEPPTGYNAYPNIRLLANHYKPMQAMNSCVFKNVCFFNLISSCKKRNCYWPHKQLSVDTVNSTLATLTNDTFIEEYLLLRNWPFLRRLYGSCYVESCIARGLTRCLIEMSIDFCKKARDDYKDDAFLKLGVLESTLMYLNSADLSQCEDILQYMVSVADDKQICDLFMETIAKGQNFSQFKRVFLKLTDFMNRVNRHFCIDDVVHILERVCILPYEESLFKAMVKMILNTDSKIFDNSMMTHFESKLKSSNKELFNEYNVLKDEKIDIFNDKNIVIKNSYLEPPTFVSSPIEDNHNIMPNYLITEREKTYTSPDTTEMDNLMRPTDEKIGNKLIDVSKIQIRVENRSPSQSSSEEFWPKAFHLTKNLARSWSPGARGARGRGFSPPGRTRPPLRGMKRPGNSRNVTYGGPPPKYSRLSRPHF